MTLKIKLVSGKEIELDDAELAELKLALVGTIFQISNPAPVVFPVYPAPVSPYPWQPANPWQSPWYCGVSTATDGRT